MMFGELAFLFTFGWAAAKLWPLMFESKSRPPLRWSIFQGVIAGSMGDLLSEMGRAEQKRLVQDYIETHKDEGYWIDVYADRDDKEEWVYIEPERKTFDEPYYVQVVPMGKNKYTVYADDQINDQALTYCPCDDAASVEDALDIMAAGWRSRGNVEVIPFTKTA